MMAWVVDFEWKGEAAVENETWRSGCGETERHKIVGAEVP